jgi:hypothetical protein
LGSFFGSVQIRSIDREQIVQAAEKTAREMNIKCLVGPAISDWVGIYPEHNGQDDGVGKAIAAKCGGDVVHLLVHDDDVTAYWWWRDRQLQDSYCSKPGYFGDEDRAQEETQVGQPDLLAELAPGKADELRRILDRDGRYTFEGERLDQLARTLGIANASTAYEYLKAGERAGIRGWKDFVEVPREDIDREKQAKRAARNQLKELTKQLKSEGLLLLHVTKKDKAPLVALVGDGFLVGWQTFGGKPVVFEHYGPPWKSESEVPIPAEPFLMTIDSDATGSRIAFALGKHIVIRNVDDWSVLTDVTGDEGGHAPTLSPDGQFLVYSTSNRAVVTRLNDGRVTALIPGTTRRFAMHPKNRWLAGVAATLTIASLDSGEEPCWRELFVGGRYQEPDFIAALRKERWRDLKPENVESQIEDAITRAMAGIQKLAKKNSDQETLAKIRARVEAQMRSTMSALKNGPPQHPPRGNETPLTFGFSADGSSFWCGTERGLRIYEWNAVVESSDGDMPLPRYQYDVAGASSPGHQPQSHIHAAVEEPGGTGLLFAGMTGRLYRMDLSSGEVRELLVMPGEPPILDFTLSRDGKTLGIVSAPGKLEPSGRRELGRVWTVWSYERLLQA